MGLEVSPGRLLARLAERGAIMGANRRVRRPSSYAPPAVPVADDASVVDADRAAVCTRLLRALLLGDDLGPVVARLAPGVIAWTPNLLAVSRDQLLAATAAADVSEETLSEVSLEVSHAGVAGERVYSEWRLTARFTAPWFIDDDVLVEPTGQLLENAGVQVVTFVGDQVASVRCFYDGFALLEQLIASR